MNIRSPIQLYISRQASSPARYWFEQSLIAVLGWIPTAIGIGLRAVFYRMILKMTGIAAIERNVRLRYANHIKLGDHSYLDEEYIFMPARRGWKLVKIPW